jgi:hypothetical protein
MSIADARAELDHQHNLIVVLLNARDEEVTYPFSVFPCPGLVLHPILADSADPVVHFADLNPATCTFHIPARTAAVFWRYRSADEQIYLLSGRVNDLVAAGVLNAGQGNSLNAKLNNARRSAQRGNNNAAGNQVEAFIHEVQALVAAGILPPETGDSLIADAQGVLERLGS